MIASFQMPNYWTWKIFVCTVEDEDSPESIIDFYKDQYSVDFSDLEADAPCCLVNEESLVAAICLKNWKKDNFNIGLLSHEVVHLLIAISSATGCEMNNHTTECWAYAMQSFVETILDMLDKKGEIEQCS